MPTYTYRCLACGCDTDVLRPMANLDDPLSCADCGRPLARRLTATQGLLTGYGKKPTQASAAHPTLDRRADGRMPSGKQPNATLTNCSVINCGGAAIHAEGPVHLDVQNLTAIGNAGPAFELKDGATVEANGVFHHTARNNTSSKRKKPREQRPRRRKKK
jgi:putative FmdB family regulatory protein